MKIKIAVVISEKGTYRCAGPFDYYEGEYTDAMQAARCWTSEAGEIIVSSYWVSAELPDPIKAPLEGFVEEVQC